MRCFNVISALICTILQMLCATESMAGVPSTSGALTAELTYKGDVLGVVGGGTDRRARYLDDVELTTTIDLDRVASWRGATLYVHLLNNLGGKPNDGAGTLQGIDNIEVSDHRARLFQAWLEQRSASGRASLLIGLYDLNSEFYHTDAAALLIAPAFGIGSELAASGPNGPSIFPSTALTARARILTHGFYVQAALLNARAGTVGDDQGVGFMGRDGLLAIGEIGWSGNGKLALGYWRYSKRQPAIIPPGIFAESASAISRGAYILAEYGLAGSADGPRYVQAFARVGLSDGRTTPFRGGWQGGVLISHLFASRPESALSMGMNAGILSSRYRRRSSDLGIPLSRSERGLEITYRDRLLPHVTLQPDVQYVRHPSGDRSAADVIVVGLRVQADFSIGRSTALSPTP